jgi:peptidoglycan/xylan/chitin deacetylase (PgdA/CDA1 family)
MRRGIRALGIGFVLMLAGGYVLQLDDSTHAGVVSRAPAGNAWVATTLVAQRDHAGREYYVKRSWRDVIPLGARTITMPILVYHYVRTPPSIRDDYMGYRLSVSPQDFTAQMDWLAAHNYHPIDFDDVRAYFAGVNSLPSKPVVITLDDGYRDLYTTAYPILAAHGFKAVAYIVSSFVGQSRYVSADQILEMDRGGIQIASHTVNHANLARASYGSIMYELVESKRSLERLVGHPVVDFAYPSGKFSASVISALTMAGYDTAVTELFSYTHTMADRYMWTRVRVGGGESLADFITALGSTMHSIKVTDTQLKICCDRVSPVSVDS